MNRLNIALAAVATAATAMPAAAAPIGFTGAYEFATWTASNTVAAGGSASVSSDKQTLTLFEPNNGGFNNGFNFSHAIASTGTLSFNWSFDGRADACCSGFNVYINDMLFNLANNSAAGSPYTAAQLSGAFSMAVTAGDSFTFQQYSSDSCCGASFTVITDFDVQGVPEPAMLGLFGFGVLGLGTARRRRVVA